MVCLERKKFILNCKSLLRSYSFPIILALFKGYNHNDYNKCFFNDYKSYMDIWKVYYNKQ